ncbi:MAG TPA: hypothetical protein VNE42_03805 [Acidimicrobiales bacterium]|nr:hypothetical protein [Acidimicrobiales bacterium]
MAPDHRTGVDEREHVVAFVDEKLKTTDPPVDGRLLVLIDRVAVGGGGGGGGGGATSVSVWVEVTDSPAEFVAENVMAHCCWEVSEATDAS